MKIYPVDILRKEVLRSYENLCRKIYDVVINTSDNESINEIIGSDVDLSNFKSFLKLSSVEILTLGLNYGIIQGQGNLVQANFMTSVNDNFCSAYHIEDKKLLDSILNSKFSKVPIELIKNPHDITVIGLPCRMTFPDGSNDKFDVIVSINTNARIIDEGYDSKKVWAVLFYDSSFSTKKVNWITFVTDNFSYVDGNKFIYKDIYNNREWNGDEFLAAKVFLMVSKILSFLITPSCCIEKVYKKAKKKSSEDVKKSFRNVHLIKFNKEYKKYIYYDNTPSGRKLNVRVRVVGHFKSFKKGKLSGRIIWCPPHWRGPELSQQIVNDYIVE